MTSLEFIEKEIAMVKKKISMVKSKFTIKGLTYYHINEIKEEINILRDRLQVLQQIKSILVAWEVCKKNYHINKYEDINKGRDKKRFDITIWLNTENCDFKSCASYEDILKVKKALEVENEKEN